jgi:hypothetical protein
MGSTPICILDTSSIVNLNYFNKLDLLVRIKLFQSFCTSMYGCELRSLADRVIAEFYVAWKKSLRRVLNLPGDSHSYLLSLLSCTLPDFIGICKRSARFISSCLNSRSILVQSVGR